jgi:hypothetical protein
VRLIISLVFVPVSVWSMFDIAGGSRSAFDMFFFGVYCMILALELRYLLTLLRTFLAAKQESREVDK